MERRVILLGALLLVSCGPTRANATSFLMCQRGPHGDARILLDFRRGMGIYDDFEVRIRRCAGRPRVCIYSPFPFSGPPSPPNVVGRTARWHAGGGSFEATLLEKEGRRTLFQMNSQVGERRFRYLYSSDQGLEEMQEMPSSRRYDDIVWVRCRGNLFWEE
jgi:hypothetical protein